MSTKRKPDAEYDLTVILARLDQLEASDKQKSERIAALEARIGGVAVPPDGYVTMKQAAHALSNVTVQRVSQLIKEGRLVSKKIGGLRWIDATSLTNFKELETQRCGKGQS